MPLHLPTLPSPTPSSHDSYKTVGLQFMRDEAELFNAIKEFNDEYTKYAACKNNSESGFGVNEVCDKAKVNSSYLKILNLNINTRRNINDPNDLTAGIQFYDNNQSQYFDNHLIDKDVYNSNHEYILDTYHKNILKLRNDLDFKLNQLYETNGAFLSDYKMEFDGSIYTGILWTILATSIIYYVFTRE